MTNDFKFGVSSTRKDFIGGFRIIQSIHATQPKEEVIVRSWKERWFSRPWRPFKKTKTVVTQEPAMYQMMDRLIVHPALMESVRERIKERGIL